MNVGDDEQQYREDEDGNVEGDVGADESDGMD